MTNYRDLNVLLEFNDWDVDLSAFVEGVDGGVVKDD